MRSSLLVALAVLLHASLAYAQNKFTADVQMCSGRPWIDVTCNGADPTGAADSTTAIQNTITSAVSNDWPVFFPSGTYKVSSKITVEYGGQAANGPQIISQAAFIDGRTITSGNVLQVQCTGGTTASPVVCNHFGIQGWLTVMGSGVGYVVTIGKTDFSDQQNGARIEHLVVTNAGAGGAIQANYVTDGDLWLSGSTQGGSASIGAVALEQVQTSKIGGYGSALGASAPALLLENGASVNNSVVGFAYDPNTSTCISITSASATRNAWMAPYLPCATAVNAPSNPTQNALIGPTFAGSNIGATSPGIGVIGRGSLSRYAAPAVAAKTLYGADDGTLFSAANATGPATGFTAASLPITLPNPAQVGAGYTVGFVTDANKAVVVSTAGGNILLAGQTLSQLLVGAPNSINFEVAVLVSDGTNFRVEHLTQGSGLYNGAQTALPARWEFPGGPGYVATQGDNGMMVSSAQAAGVLTVTLPQTTQIQPGYMLGLAVGAHHAIQLNVNSSAGGAIYLTDGTSHATQTFYRDQSIQVFQFDGTTFRQIAGAPLGDVRDFGADPSGATDSTTAVQLAVNAICAAGGIVQFPAGTFKIHDITAATCNGIHFIGSGKGGTPLGDGGVQIGETATVLDCSAMSDHCIQIGPNSATPSATRYVGGSIENLSTYNAGGSGVVFRIHQQFAGHIARVWMETPPHSLEFYGNENVDTSWVDIRNNTADPAIEVWGDLNGKASNGTACVLGDCSTRQDITTFNHINGYGPNAYLFYVHDQTFGTNGSFGTWEGGLGGFKVRCAPGKPNLGYCPQQFHWFDFENEYGTLPLDLQDFSVFSCETCYFAGIGGGGSAHVGVATLTNYSQSGGGGGSFILKDTTVYGANGSCLVLSVTDVELLGDKIFGCNLANNPIGQNDAAVEFAGTSHENIITGNKFCNFIGAGGFPNEIGLLFGGGTYRMSLANNSYYFCQQNLYNAATQGYSIYETNANPAPPFGSTQTPAGCGSGCTVTTGNGNQLGGSLLITAGSGAGSSGSFTINFTQPLYPTAICAFTLHNGGTGTWQAGATAQVETPTSSQVAVSWDNNGVALTAGGGYFIDYRCSGY